MNVFDRISYIAGPHVIDRLPERISNNLDKDKSKLIAEYLCETGEILLTTDTERYIRNEGYTFPCVISTYDERKYFIKTLLTSDMVVKSV